ncbi:MULTISPECIES: hypothetical protein [unclassified Streptomyces]|uniref:hypothetical protein n=1 Tax=unclassified Streptomyces TaxID=2593676 RepID=UPI0037F34EAD
MRSVRSRRSARTVRSGLAVLAACAAVVLGSGAAHADVTVEDEAEPSVTIVFGDWVQIAGDDVFTAGHDNTVGSDN